MSAKGSYSATAVDSIIVPASNRRGAVTILNTDGPQAMWIAFGVPAVVGEGIKVASTGGYQVTGYLSNLDIHGICDTGETSVGSYQEG